MSGMPLGVHFDDVEEPGCEQLLALRHVRRDLECLPAGQLPAGVEPVAVARGELARELRELIAALDRRVPRVESAGEASIASDAAALREKAVRRLAELIEEGSDARAASRPDHTGAERET